MKQAHNMPTPSLALYEINICQTQVKSPKATKSIFHRQEVIKSPDPDLPVFESASSPVVKQQDGSMPSEASAK